ncbi:MULTISPECIES: DUF1963 domain-containing protein [Saccharibacillus]|uniref:DUF1963 domain-containing protein n=1 Tax=Saccharibacillus TaxID=456492 RepID=UPI0012398837|nr:YwqG family protein [Saccharibacillus sp. WB 17]MWJ33095.1 DUF1963 domain-containing protein [Saccharibacillus sp. WB 17]
MSLSDDNRKRLEKAIRECDFAHAEPYLLANAKQTILWSGAAPGSDPEIGGSRAGGEPDLPAGTQWPLGASGVPLTFVMQLKLDDVQGLDPERRMPERGTLFFFAGDYDLTVEHRVLHAAPEQMQGAARQSPPGPTAHDEYGGPFKPRRLVARASLDLPGYAYVDEEATEDEEHGWEEYEDLGFALHAGEPAAVAKMFGYAEGQHGDDEYRAALELFGCESTYYPEEAIDRLTRAFDGDRERALREIAGIVMLAEIDSDSDVGFMWGDAGVLHYFIRAEDLLAGRFDRTTCSFYSS